MSQQMIQTLISELTEARKLFEDKITTLQHEIGSPYITLQPKDVTITQSYVQKNFPKYYQSMQYAVTSNPGTLSPEEVDCLKQVDKRIQEVKITHSAGIDDLGRLVSLFAEIKFLEAQHKSLYEQFLAKFS